MSLSVGSVGKVHVPLSASRTAKSIVAETKDVLKEVSLNLSGQVQNLSKPDVKTATYLPDPELGSAYSSLQLPNGESYTQASRDYQRDQFLREHVKTIGSQRVAVVEASNRSKFVVLVGPKIEPKHLKTIKQQVYKKSGVGLIQIENTKPVTLKWLAGEINRRHLGKLLQLSK